jgi:hypothetical protein
VAVPGEPSHKGSTSQGSHRRRPELDRDHHRIGIGIMLPQHNCDRLVCSRDMSSPAARASEHGAEAFVRAGPAGDKTVTESV